METSHLLYGQCWRGGCGALTDRELGWAWDQPRPRHLDPALRAELAAAHRINITSVVSSSLTSEQLQCRVQVPERGRDRT